jgi:multidrug efflux pump subunit AcrA (membrane-fusion protein)
VAMTKLIYENKADLFSAKIKKEIYEKDYLATKKLFETSTSVSEEHVWEKELQYKSALSDYEKILMIEEKEKLEFEVAVIQLEKRILRTPYDGEIVRIHKNISENAQALEDLVDIADVSFCRMTVYIAVAKAASLKKNQEVRLKLNGAKQKRFRKGSIEFISPIVDRSSMLRTVKIIFNNEDKSIEPGVTGEMIFQ